MFTVILIMMGGVAVGYLLRGKNINLVSRLIMLAIYLLLFFLGVAVGGNPQIINNLHTIGLDALIITLAAVLGSALAAMFVYKRYFKNGI